MIIIDFSLPGMNGQMIVAAIRAMEAMRAVPLVIISGLIREAVAESLLSAGVSRVILKPITSDEYLRLALSLEAISSARARPTPGP